MVRVRYVTGRPPLRHTFEGAVEEVTPDWIRIRTTAGTQRLLATGVLRVWTLSRGKSRLVAQGAVIGAGVLTLVGAPMLKAMSESNLHPAHIIVPAAIGAASGSLVGSLFRGTREDIVYVRR